MKIVGLTGSIAMGKSEVVKHLRHRGLAVFDADQTVHDLYSDGTAARALRTSFPQAVQGKKIDRAILSHLLQEDPARLKALEALIHPLVHERRAAFLAEAREQGSVLAVLDIPLLFETHAEGDVDVVVLITAPEALQRQRALARPGMTPEKLALILARQMPDAEKRKRAHFVIDNSGDLAHLAAATDAVLAALTRS
ncbi:MAG TPA: dephospho-CoA kinase [Aestuariivirga sp.]|nr:dephospho-CoA kinase [Aestuariivirga sp.]